MELRVYDLCEKLPMDLEENGDEDNHMNFLVTVKHSAKSMLHWGKESNLRVRF